MLLPLSVKKKKKSGLGRVLQQKPQRSHSLCEQKQVNWRKLSVTAGLWETHALLHRSLRINHSHVPPLSSYWLRSQIELPARLILMSQLRDLFHPWRDFSSFSQHNKGIKRREKACAVIIQVKMILLLVPPLCVMTTQTTFPFSTPYNTFNIPPEKQSSAKIKVISSSQALNTFFTAAAAAASTSVQAENHTGHGAG